jgi:hypothetical protein
MKTIILFLTLCLASITYSQEECFKGTISNIETEGGGCAIYIDSKDIVVEFSYDEEGNPAYKAPKDFIVYYNDDLNCKINPKYGSSRFHIVAKKTTALRYNEETAEEAEEVVYLLVAIYIE